VLLDAKGDIWIARRNRNISQFLKFARHNTTTHQALVLEMRSRTDGYQQVKVVLSVVSPMRLAGRD